MSDKRLFQNTDEQAARYAPQQLPTSGETAEDTAASEAWEVGGAQQAIVADSAATITTPDTSPNVSEATGTEQPFAPEIAAGVIGADVAREAEATQTDEENHSA
jgi:hypothetical protein